MTDDLGGQPGFANDRKAGSDLSRIYRNRFTADELAGKRSMWRVLCRNVFQKYVPADGTVVDLAAGSCEFINEIRAGRKIAVDLNPDVHDYADPGVEVVLSRSDDLSAIPDQIVDTVFTSNFFEHLPSKDALLDTLAECLRVTRPGGRIVVLMPNIRYLPGRYWDYLDHHLPLTHLSVAEALEITGYGVERIVPRFLPYTVKDSPIPVSGLLVAAYLRLRPAWLLLGKQMLVVGRRR